MSAQKLPVTIPPTSGLRSSAEKVGDDIRHIVESVTPGLTTPLKYFQYQQLVKDYEGSFCKENESILREFVSSSKSSDGIVLLQAGKLPIEAAHPVAIAITLLKIGKLESRIDTLAGTKPVDWGDVGSVIILGGNSMINSSGEGRLVCFFRVMH